MVRGDAVLIAVGDRRPQPARERLHGRGVAQVREALLRRRADPLLLLLDIRHSVKVPAERAGRW